MVGGMAFPRPKRKNYSEAELYEYAVGALARRMRTVAELKRLMRARVDEAGSEHGQTLIELVIRKLKDQGYLNDSQYAAFYSSLRRDNQKLGRMRVITELKTRGVHGSVIEKAVEAAYEGVSDEKQAREFLGRKRLEKPKDQKQAARIFRQLARAGFGTKTIFTILKKWDVDDETLSALEGEGG
jgi:regulatory protein